MVPCRLELEGFLCFRERRELDFDGSDAWLLWGENGSGKSSVFDAVTFALFGRHRDGKRGWDDLIHKERREAFVGFEFEAGGTRYRVEKRIKRATRGAARVVPSGMREAGVGLDGDRVWEEVAGTSTARGFDDWIAEVVGLSDEAFVSSVLLTQGQADRLLAATGSDRFKVLAGIVDLARYERVHARADDRRKRAKADWESARDRAQAIALVTEEELSAAEEACRAAESQLAAAREEEGRLGDRLARAGEWEALLRDRAEAERKLREFEELLSREDAIRRGAERARDLRGTLPRLREAVEARARDAELGGRIEAGEGALARSGAEVARCEGELSEAERVLAARDEEARGLLEAESRARDGLESLAGDWASVEEIARAGERLRELEKDLSRYPADLDEMVERFERAARLLGEREAAARALERMARDWDQWWKARGDHARESAEAKREAAAIEEQDRRRAEALAEWERLGSAEDAARDRMAKFRHELEAARTRLERLETLDGAAECETCGRPLDEGHVELERERRESARSEAEERLRSSKNEYERLSARRGESRRAWEEAGERLETARKRLREIETRRDVASNRMGEAARRWGEGLSELPEAAREGLKGLSEFGSAPDSEENPAMSRLETARRDWEESKRAATELEKVKQALEGRRERLVSRDNELERVRGLSAGLSAPPEEIRARRAALMAERDDLRRRRAEADRGLKTARERVEAARRAREAAREASARLERDLAGLNATRAAAREAETRAREALSAAWREVGGTLDLPGLEVLDRELRELDARGVERDWERLDAARGMLSAGRERLAELTRRMEDTPEADRITRADCEAERVRIRKALEDGEKARRAAERTRDGLRDRRTRREEAEREAMALDKRHRVREELAKLLGRDHLQRALAREAEREIVDLAAPTLDRLTGGRLRLRLRENATRDEAFSLEARTRELNDEAIPVAYLSGSQRFRVAVSLALAIGQYAGATRRPVEAVIIDEGFGSLDREGRQVMIGELRNLRGRLRRIIVVSHQEEFADAFPDGYKFSVGEGGPEVNRFREE